MSMPQTFSNVADSWHTVHQLLLTGNWPDGPVLERVDLAVYVHCVYKAFGQQADADRAHDLFEQLLIDANWQLAAAWPTIQLDKACQAAWLASQVEYCTPDLTALDRSLSQEARRLIHQGDAGSRNNFFQILRYFGLRLPLESATQRLHELLAKLGSQQWSSAASEGQQQSLGLGTGLAAELLVLIKLHRLGVGSEATIHTVRQGIIRLLAVRRAVDFQEHHFSVFPYQVDRISGEPTFGANLSWERGDLGQTLLLHEADKLLHNAELARIAELVGLNTLLRTSKISTQIYCSRLNCGAAGVAHLYGKLYRSSGQQAYSQGQQYWLVQTQRWLRQEIAASPYQPGPAELRQGLIGPGLVLLASVADIELGWDAALL